MFAYLDDDIDVGEEEEEEEEEEGMSAKRVEKIKRIFVLVKNKDLQFRSFPLLAANIDLPRDILFHRKDFSEPDNN